MKRIEPVQLGQLTADIQAVFDVLNEESDLACVLTGANFLDQILASLLKHTFIKSSVADRILNPARGLLGSYSARSDLAYCINLVEKRQYQDLRKIGEIRNRVAHSHLSLGFDDCHVGAMCNELQACKLVPWRVKLEPGEQPSEEVLRESARSKFKLSVVIIGQSLLAKAETNKSRST